VDIIVSVDNGGYKRLSQDKPYEGRFYHVLKKHPKAGLKEKIYFLVGNHIMGYGQIYTNNIIDMEAMTVCRGQIWRYINEYLIIWYDCWWFIHPVFYGRDIKERGFRYMDKKTRIKCEMGI